MTIETERLTIRTATQSEMKELAERQTDPELIKAYGEMISGCVDHPDQWEWYAVWMIELKDGTHVGDLSFKGPGGNGDPEIGYGILEEHRGKGYAKEAVNAAVNMALSMPGVRQVEAETEPDNEASKRVLQSCGFIPSGKVGEEGPRFVKKRI